MNEILGYEIIVYTNLGAMGRVIDYRVEYGPSPIRDRNSMKEKINEFMLDGVDFSIHPIIEQK